MAKKRVGEIRINRRIIQIGHQFYPLANISRVQTLKEAWRGSLATFYPLWTMIVVLLVVGSTVYMATDVIPTLDLQTLDLQTDLDVKQAGRQLAAGAVAVGGALIVCLLLVLFYRLLLRRPRYALVLETAGTQYTALTGTDRHEVERITHEIVAAITNPPSYERILQLSGDVVIGDKVARDKHQQVGTDNRMVLNR